MILSQTNVVYSRFPTIPNLHVTERFFVSSRQQFVHQVLPYLVTNECNINYANITLILLCTVLNLIDLIEHVRIMSLSIN